MNVRMLLLRHRLVEYWEGRRCHRPSALEFDTSEKPSNSDFVDCINHADRLGQRARTRRGDHSSIVIITIKTEGSACANPSVDDDATGSD